MFPHVKSAIHVREFVIVLGVFVFRYAEATKSARNVNFAIVLIGRFYEITFEVEIKTKRDEERFTKIFETNFTSIFFDVVSAEEIELVQPVQIPVVQISAHFRKVTGGFTVGFTVFAIRGAHLGEFDLV